MLTKCMFIHCFKTFSNQTLCELHKIVKKITCKMNALSKKAFFSKILFENPVPLNEK